MKVGRPSSYTPGIALKILHRLADGKSLRAICRADHLPAESTVRAWVARDVEGFASRYFRARNFGLDRLVDEIVMIADDASEPLALRRLRMDARIWHLSKLEPKCR